MVGQKAMVTWSDDEGKTWTKPVEPFTAPSIDGRPGIFRQVRMTSLGDSKVMAVLYWLDHSDPDLPFYNAATEGLLDSRIFISTSSDNGETWSDLHKVDTSPYDVPVPITGPVILLPDGRLACQFEVNKHYYDLEQWRHVPAMVFSSDGGETWGDCVVPCSDPSNRIFYWDQRPALMNDGRLLDLFWTYDTKDAVYLNMHAVESLDNGRTWSRPWDTGVPGQPAPAVSLNDGRIVMVYVSREKDVTIRARISEDKGLTWPDSTEKVIYETDLSQNTEKRGMEDAWAEMMEFSVGLPDTALLPDGDVLVSHYAGPQTDRTSIHWIRLRALD